MNNVVLAELITANSPPTLFQIHVIDGHEAQVSVGLRFALVLLSEITETGDCMLATSSFGLKVLDNSWSAVFVNLGLFSTYVFEECLLP